MNSGDKVTSLADEGLLSADQLLLLKQALFLLEREKANRTQGQIVDYGFLVFTAAKVYEGFLKAFFFQLGLIGYHHYHDAHFRIGKALNPDLPLKYRNATWLFNDLARACGPQSARELWETWRSGRNEIFHYFPDNGNVISLGQAEKLIETFIRAMHTASACEVRLKR